MNYKVLVLEEAENDIDEAFAWYESKSMALGIEFYENVQAGIKGISQNPFGSMAVYRVLRRYVVNKFPYGIYYLPDERNKILKVIGVIHFKRSSKVWKKRL